MAGRASPGAGGGGDQLLLRPGESLKPRSAAAESAPSDLPGAGALDYCCQQLKESGAEA